MPRPAPAASPRVESLEAREIPAFGLDTTFAAGGIAVDVSGTALFYRLGGATAGPGNTVVAAGTLLGSDVWGTGGDVAVARVTAAGKADPTFGGGDGLATFSFSTPHTATAVAVQTDGKILVTGFVGGTDPGNDDAYVLRMNADGTRDATFGTNGEVVIDFGGSDGGTALAVQSDGKIVLGGVSDPTNGTDPYMPSNQLALARLTTTGALDKTFGTNGKVTAAPGGDSWGVAGVAIRPDGRIVVGGSNSGSIDGSSPIAQLAVAQYTATGTIDSSFGSGGYVETQYEYLFYGSATDLALLPDGRAVVGGTHGGSRGLLAWFDAAGTLPRQEMFGQDGLWTIEDVVPAAGGGVRVVGSKGSPVGGYTVESRPAPGTLAGSIDVIPARYTIADRIVTTGDGKTSVVSFVGASWNADPYARGGSLSVVRLSDPGATSTPTTSVRWLTPATTGPGRVALTVDVAPLLGSSQLTQGTVTFKEGQTVLGTVNLADSEGWEWWQNPPSVLVDLPGGPHTITAEFSGAPGWNPSAATQTIQVDYTAEVRATLTVSDPAPDIDGGRMLHVSLTRPDGGMAPASGTVSFYNGSRLLGDSDPLWGGDAYLILPADALAPGTHTLRAVYSGTPGYTGAESPPVTVTVADTKVATETVLAAASPTPVVGAPFTLTATVRKAGGAAVTGGRVTFTDGATTLGTAAVGADGVATLTTPLQLGTRTLRASYSGGPYALASTARAVSVVVGKAPTATDLVASTKPIIANQAVTLTASVRVTAGAAFPIGTVEFRVGTRVLGTVKLDGRGQAKLTTTALGTGTHAVTAVYSGASTCVGSTSAAATLSTGRASTTTALTAAVAAPVFGQPQTLTARVSGATAGRVDFFDGQVFLGSAGLDATGAAAFTFASNLGAHRYRAVFAGTDAATGSASGWLSQSVAKAKPSVYLARAADGSLTATVRAPYAGAPIGTVTFKEGNTVLGTAAVNGNGVATFRLAGRVAAGLHRVTAVYGGSSCFLGADSTPLDVTV